MTEREADWAPCGNAPFVRKSEGAVRQRARRAVLIHRQYPTNTAVCEGGPRSRQFEKHRHTNARKK
jgi:hypothetical protein